MGRAMACAAVALLVAVSTAAAVSNQPQAGQSHCSLSTYHFALSGNLVVVGIPYSGSQIRIDATTMKFDASTTSASSVCDELLVSVTTFRWSIASVPSGQSAAIANAGTLSPGVNVGGPGIYRIRLTVCPATCPVKYHGQTTHIPAQSRVVTVTAIDQYVPPPATEPPTQLPVSPPVSVPNLPDNNASCHGGLGFTNPSDPQWVNAAGHFIGPADYELVEGKVTNSFVSSSDLFLNHDSEDANWDVIPDPRYAPLTQRSFMEMEWEINSYPNEFRPTAGDRASTLGFWVLDCAHAPFNLEIHPPVGVAVERPRAVEIPPSFRPSGYPNGLGSNIQVPGIVTDIYFNRQSGGITNGCHDTGLHDNAFFPHVVGACIGEPHPLGTATFHVYLPPDPQQRARDLGYDAPAVPLFVGTQALGQGTGGPEPTVTVCGLPAQPQPPDCAPQASNGVTWLQVTVDLSRLTDMTYARRISAAWAYPDPGNWGARRWRIGVGGVRVFNEVNNDWRFFFNTNNRDKEWTTLNSCNGCINAGTDYMFSAQTGSATSRLGPDPVLFPGEPIVVHTNGFNDGVTGGDVGTVFDLDPQMSGTYHTLSQGGDGSYRLDYVIGAGPPIANATLTREASALRAAYVFRAPVQCQIKQAQAARRAPPLRPVCGSGASAPLDPNLVRTWHPNDLVLGRHVQSARGLDIFTKQDREERTLIGMPVSQLRHAVNVLRARNPSTLNTLLADIKHALARVPRKLRRTYYPLIAKLDQTLPAQLVRRALPRGFPAHVRPPRSGR